MKRISMIAATAALGITGSAVAQGHSGNISGGHGSALSSSSTPIGTDLPDANTGECFARVIIPAVYDDVPQTVTTQESYDRLSVTEPHFAPDTVSVQVRDEGVKYIVRQPRYETRTEEILAKPAYERLTVVPAQFDTVSEQIQVGQPRLVWRPGKHLSAISRTDPDTGAVYCLVEEPGEIVTVSRRVVRVPEQVTAVSVPAQYTTVTKQVLVDPGGVDQQPIPAEFQSVPVSRLVQPAGQVAQPVAPQTQTVNTRVLRTPERFEWAPVLCNTNANQASISRVQGALAQAGYYNGPVNGVADQQTHAALRSFQASQGLPIHGNITADTANALGVGDVVSGTRQAAGAPGSFQQVASTPTPTQRTAPATQVATQPALPAVTNTQTATPAQPALRQTRRRLNWAGKKP